MSPSGTLSFCHSIYKRHFFFFNAIFYLVSCSTAAALKRQFFCLVCCDMIATLITPFFSSCSVCCHIMAGVPSARPTTIMPISPIPPIRPIKTTVCRASAPPQPFRPVGGHLCPPQPSLLPPFFDPSSILLQSPHNHLKINTIRKIKANR